MAAPVLDRLITRTVPGASSGLNPLGQPLPSAADTEVSVWAARRDFRARDWLNIGDGQHFEQADRRFVVRAGGLAWDVGDTFRDDAGENYTVRGVSQIGRGRFLELLVRS